MDPNAAPAAPSGGDQYETLKAAVQGATQLTTPNAAGPLSEFPDIAKLYSSSFQLPLSNAATAVQANNTALTVKAQQEADALKKQQEKDMIDPSKYQKIPTQDGGFDFVAPNGQKISAYQYAQITGKSLDSILKGSQNPIDIGFAQDYNNLQNYMNDKIASKNDPNSDAAQRAKAIEDKVQQETGINLHNAKISDVMSAFQAAYPTVFGNGGFNGAHTAGIPTGQTFLPNQDYAKANALSAGGGIAH